MFNVHGRDGKDYRADLSLLREWVRSGNVTRDDQVFWYRTGQWTTAGAIPMLQDLFPAPATRPKSWFPIGCVVTIGVLFAVFVIGSIIEQFGDFGKRARTTESTETRGQSVPAQSSSTDSQAATATPAQRRVAAAAELQRIFEASDLKGWELKFEARGRRCDALHVHGDVNLYPEMMDALGYGTVMYGKILPGGVNHYAFAAGFRDVVYTNPSNSKSRAYGESQMTREQIRKARVCTSENAAGIDASSEAPVARSAEPKFEQLSWDNARVGLRLYDGSYKHEVTVVSLDRANDLMEVKYVRSGRIEPKKLTTVAQFWYVKSD
jgi:hypothetical protein